MTNPEIYKDVDVELDALFNNNLESKSDMAHSAIQKALYDDQLAKHRLFIDNQNQDPLERIKAIDQVLQENPEFPLSFDDLDLIYDLDGELTRIDSTSYEHIPIAHQIRQNRNIVQDLNTAFAYEEEWREGSNRRDLNLNWLTEAKGLILPKYLEGDLDLGSLTSAEGLTLPRKVGGDLDLGSLTSAEGLTLPLYLGTIGFTSGSIIMTQLQTAKGLVFPRNILGTIYLPDKRFARRISVPDYVRVVYSRNTYDKP